LRIKYEISDLTELPRFYKLDKSGYIVYLVEPGELYTEIGAELNFNDAKNLAQKHFEEFILGWIEEDNENK